MSFRRDSSTFVTSASWPITNDPSRSFCAGGCYRWLCSAKTPSAEKPAPPYSFARFMRFSLSCSGARVLAFSIFAVLIDAVTFVYLWLRSSSGLAAENLFLRKQLAMYVERKQKPRRATDSDRFMLARLMRFFDWPSALTVVKPDTLVRWHRKGFRLFWKWKSR